MWQQKMKLKKRDRWTRFGCELMCSSACCITMIVQLCVTYCFATAKSEEGGAMGNYQHINYVFKG